MNDVYCYVLKRLDTNQFYQGPKCSPYNRKNRWTDKLEKAKKYKRKCDCSNAATLMNQCGDNISSFERQTYKMELWDIECL
jgi:hypothetical protein